MLDYRFFSSLFQFYSANVFVARGKVEGKLSAIVLLEKVSLGQWKNYLPSQSQIAPILISPTVEFNLNGLMQALGSPTIKLDWFSLDSQEHNTLIKNVRNLQNYAQNIKLSISDDFATYWSNRPKRLRKDISRSINRLKKDGLAVTHKMITTPKLVSEAVDRYGMLESKGWKGINGTAIHPANTQGQFYKFLMELFAQKQHSLVYESYLADELVASRLCIFNEETLIILKTTFDESYSHYSLGNLNRYKLIEEIFEIELCKCIDFYTNASKEQLYWSTEQRPIFNGTCYRFQLIEKAVFTLNKVKVW
ncbi:MAG: GNAT family N-acetyltransferase [Colwellia sp.]|nr:GNAT family N-acetyltransferase [Colwellia sp.]MCW9080693.1 GNAT family N-acetyltransferase [Colwellia sp.]